ncbi:MAG: HD domain-containing protein [Lachnospiraceae bacterium]|nr:HD domain-containing protein [Lachnospiraceae bacterium]
MKIRKLSPLIERFTGKRSAAIWLILGAVLLNVLLSWLVYDFSMPLYLDTAGTIVVSVIAGPFPGIVVAVATNVLCSLYNDNAIYYAILNVLIAIVTSEFVRRKKQNDVGAYALYFAIIAFIGGVMGGAIQWGLFGRPQFSSISEASDAFAEATGIAKFAGFLLLNFFLNLVDKVVSVGVAFLIFEALPLSFREAVRSFSWHQNPLSKEETDAMRKQSSKKHSLQHGIARMLIFAAVSMTLVMGWISIYLYYQNAREEMTQTAQEAASLGAELIDPSHVNDYLEKGRRAEGYTETEKMLYAIRENLPAVAYLYVVKIMDDGCHFIFDLETEDTPACVPGEIVLFEDAFRPYLPALFAGDPIEPVESNDASGWVITVYHPVYDHARNCVCYVGADVFMSYLTDYVRNYLLRTLLIFSGFFLLIIGYGLWMTNYRIVFPIDSMARTTNSFVYDSSDQAALSVNIDKIKNLAIRTDDEIEYLYKALYKMTTDTADQIRDIRHHAKAITQMQDGLIITMADMVENRDSDTGAHVQKTAAYVRIILEGLKKKGYYRSKLTDKYFSDVITSAPLHDVGKISISDTILNKPGRLTDEEFEIMKGHAAAGKQLMEKVIDTVQGENYLKEARNMAGYHHEKWDGTGYPEGLYGEVIPLSARIMAVADVFDALTSKRVYKDAMPLEQALQILEDGAGTHFDPKCVEVFMDSIEEIKVILKKYNRDRH